MLRAAMAKVYTNNGHDTFTFLLELRKLRQLFAQTGRRLLQFKREVPKAFKDRESRKWLRDRALRSKSFQRKQTVDAIADWLSARYGYRPLAKDLKDLNAAIANLKNEKSRHSERTGRSYSTRTVEHLPGSFTSTNYERVVQTQVEVSIRGSVVADIKPPSFRFNPAATGWELLPYSFVADWFWDVGKTIEAASFLVASSDYVSAHGFQVKVNRRMELISTGFKSGWSGEFSQVGQAEATYEERSPSSVSLIPSFRPKLDALKILDLAALVGQRLL
jgi:hypothetical protein